MNIKTLNKCIEMARAMRPATMELRTFHVSFAVKGARIICLAQNVAKTHPVNRRNLTGITDFNNYLINNKSVCSELNLFLQGKKRFSLDWSRHTIVNVRIMADGSVGMSKPCASCQNLISYIRPRALYYSVDGGGFMEYSLS